MQCSRSSFTLQPSFSDTVLIRRTNQLNSARLDNSSLSLLASRCVLPIVSITHSNRWKLKAPVRSLQLPSTPLSMCYVHWLINSMLLFAREKANKNCDISVCICCVTCRRAAKNVDDDLKADTRLLFRDNDSSVDADTEAYALVGRFSSDT